MDPRVKILLTIAYIVMLFIGSNPLGLAISTVFLALLYGMSKIPLKLIARSIKPILPIIAFTAVLNPVSYTHLFAAAIADSSVIIASIFRKCNTFFQKNQKNYRRRFLLRWSVNQ